MLSINSTCEIYVGIDDLSVTTNKSCARHHHLKTQFNICFQIEGRFLNSALSDKISQTVDYDLLSRKISAALAELSCTDESRAQMVAKSVSANFSPLITDTYCEIKPVCHRALPLMDGLL